ncbi:MAG: M1 family metallopeptidase [Planctomycetes bacterium]|nr:M1 family metallopeptidase [Planctomycetota bacterium]
MPARLRPSRPVATRLRVSAAFLAGVVLGASPPPLPADEGPREFLETLHPDARAFAARVTSPTTYRIDFELDPDFLTFKGREEVTLVNRSRTPFQEACFHIYPNASFVAEEGTRNIVVTRAAAQGAEAAFTLSGTVLRVPLAAPVAPGASVKVEISWKGILPRQSGEQKDMMAQGMEQLGEMLGAAAKEKQGDYGLYAAVKGTLNMALWYPALAAYEDAKGWDTRAPSGIGDFGFFEVSNYEVRLTVPRDMSVACSGIQVAEAPAPAGGDLVTRTFRAGYARDFVVQMSRKFKRVSRDVDGVTVNSWYLPGDEAGGRKVLEYAAAAVALYNRMYGMYAYRELDLVEAHLKGGAGGVEFPGCVTVNSMFYPSGAKAATGGGQLGELMKQLGGGAGGLDLEAMLEFTVVHEVSHQWWNAAVGSDAQEYPFIDESMANCTSVLYFESCHGPEAAKAQTASQLAMPFQMLGLFGTKDAAVNQPASAFKNSMQYAAVVYGKGALYYLKLRELTGVKAWEAGVQEYYRAYFFGIAPPRGLTDAVAKASGRAAEVDRLYRRWILETHGVEDIGAENSMLDNPLVKELLGGAAGGGGGADLKELEDLLKELGGGKE